MDAIALLKDVEAIYRKILDLTLRQEAILGGGYPSELPAVVSEKFALLDRAQALLGEIGPDEDRNAPTFQEGIHGLARVLEEVVASEDRCRALAPAPKPVTRESYEPTKEEFRTRIETEAPSKQITTLRSMFDELRFPTATAEVTLLILRYASEVVNRAILFMAKKDEVRGPRCK